MNLISVISSWTYQGIWISVRVIVLLVLVFALTWLAVFVFSLSQFRYFRKLYLPRLRNEKYVT